MLKTCQHKGEIKRDISSKQEQFLALSQDAAMLLLALGSPTEWTLVDEGGFGKVYSGNWKHMALHKTSVAIKQLKESQFPPPLTLVTILIKLRNFERAIVSNNVKRIQIIHIAIYAKL